jgi:quercetin dioxygenase-like cupin family protein
MFLTSKNDLAPDRSEGWGSQDGSEVRWLLDADSGGTRGGAVGLVDLEPGAAQEAHRHPGGTEASMILSGNGTFLLGDREIEGTEGSVLYVPAGTRHAIVAGDGPLTLLTVLTGGPRAADSGWERALDPESGEGTVLSGTEQEEIVLDDPDQGFLKMNARWVVNSDTCGSAALVLGRNRFAVEGAHELHKHTDAEEFFLLLRGEGAHLGENEEVYVSPGEIALLPADEWHGFRNTGGAEASGVFGYLGIGKFEQAGYVLAPETGS